MRPKRKERTIKMRMVAGKWWLIMSSEDHRVIRDFGPYKWDKAKDLHDRLIQGGYKKEQ